MASLAMRARFLFYRAKTAGLRAPTWRRAAGGCEMLIDPADPVDLAFVSGNFAHELRRHIGRCVPVGGVAIDAGAQKGFITLALAQAVGPTGRVVSFEPDPRSFAILRQNCERNRVGQVQALDCALSDTAGEAEFLLSTQLGWSGLTHYEALDRTLARRITVQTRPLDELVASLGVERLDFVKVDCQGAETAIVRGMRRTVERFAPDLWLEIDHEGLKGAGSSEGELFGLLSGMGYSLYRPRLVRRLQVPIRVDYEPLTSLPTERGDYDVLATRRPVV